MRILALFLILAACTAKTPPGPEGLVLAALKDYKVEYRREFRVKDNPGTDFRYTNGKSEIQIKAIEDVESEGFEKAVALRDFELSRPFREERSPYPGAVTASVKCGEAFRPKIKKGTNTWRADFQASGRKTLICDERDAVVKVSEMILYCAKARRLFTITASQPKSADGGDVLASADCAP